MNVRVFPDTETMSRSAVELVIEKIREAVLERDIFYFCLSGGGSPKRLYELLAEPSASDQIPWAKVHVFWGDERAVPPDHPDSNYRLADQALLSRVSLPQGNIHRMPAERRPLSDGATEYEMELKRVFKLEHGQGLPQFDLTLLGVGTDGHTASLFPHSPALGESERWVVSVRPPQTAAPTAERLTLTYPIISASRLVVFLAAGENKRSVVSSIFNTPDQAAGCFPAARIRAEGQIFWYVDTAAYPGE